MATIVSSKFAHLSRHFTCAPRRFSSRFKVLPGPTPGSIQVPRPLSPIANEPMEHFQMSSEPRDETLNYPDYFNVRKLFTIGDLFNARVHLGHAVGNLDDRMRQFVFGKRFNQVVFDLDITAQYLQDALNFIAHVAYRGGIILFVSRSRETTLMVERTAMEAGEYSHTR
ncbi:28S ribosomal protein S2, mitochondrial-like [Paramacrobiotus metropolitanus]|uniref:28S ribosomal protein S2, mitochondrial-like n=1 Tax=Paramacrobiotus metropolitanus TaxID=2943436 RepID=UPI00244628A5|nr:28S ribosomal protein S2, mitochondrial-like [Paramacrobiotus metropolitanus]